MPSTRSQGVRSRYYGDPNYRNTSKGREPHKTSKPKAERSAMLGAEFVTELAKLNMSINEFCRVAGITANTGTRYAGLTEPGQMPEQAMHPIGDGTDLKYGITTTQIADRAIEMAKAAGIGTLGLFSREVSRVWTQRAYDALQAEHAPPYPFCRTPEQCAGKGYCQRDPACND